MKLLNLKLFHMKSTKKSDNHYVGLITKQAAFYNALHETTELNNVNKKIMETR